MDFDLPTLNELASDIWASMLGVTIVPADGVAADLGHEASVTGCVQITGDWAGAVTVRCPSELARSFAAAMFGCDAADLSVEEVRDAIGELTNMTGGSVKGLVPGECQLGIPAVAEGLDYSLTIPKGKQVSCLEFTSEGHALEIVVYQMV